MKNRVKIRFGWLLLFACSLSILCRAEPGPWREDAAPWHALAWSPVPEECTNITPFVWAFAEHRSLTPAKAAETLRKVHEGHRALFIWDLHRKPVGLFWHSKDRCRTPEGELTEHVGLWPEHGIEAVAGQVRAYLEPFKEAGGLIDYLVLDCEWGYQNWGKKKEWFEAVENDPRSAELKQRLGFDDFASVRNLGNKRYLDWNAETSRMRDRTIERAIFDVVREYFPDALCSNYRSYLMSKKHVVPEMNGHLQHSISFAGQIQTTSFYGRFRQLAYFKLDGRTPYVFSPLNVVRWHINQARGIRRSSDALFAPWLCHQSYKQNLLRNNEGYAELVLHMLLHIDDIVLYWNPGKAGPFIDDARLLDALVAEVNGVVPAGRRRVAAIEPIPWDCPILVSGIETKEKTIWRVSCFEGDAKALRPISGDFVDGKYVLEHDGWRLSIPEAAPCAGTSSASSLGCWVATPGGCRYTLQRL